MDIVYREGELSARQILEALADPPSYSAVRGLLRVLGEKGHLRYREDGVRYVYSPTVPRDQAQVSALGRVLTTFFKGSAELAVAALLDLREGDLTDEELDRMAELIEAARDERR